MLFHVYFPQFEYDEASKTIDIESSQGGVLKCEFYIWG